MTAMIIVFAIIVFLVYVVKALTIDIIDGRVVFRIWPFHEYQRLSLREIDEVKLGIGMFPLSIRFLDGSCYRWIAFPIRRMSEVEDMFKKEAKKMGIPIKINGKVFHPEKGGEQGLT
jgi:hypothetical protein